MSMACDRLECFDRVFVAARTVSHDPKYRLSTEQTFGPGTLTNMSAKVFGAMEGILGATRACKEYEQESVQRRCAH